MKITTTLASVFLMIATTAHAADVYDDYDAYYAAQTGALFASPVKRDEGKVYSDAGEDDIYIELNAAIDGKPAQIQVASNRLKVHRKTYKFTKAVSFPDERVVDVNPGSVRVFIAGRKGNRPPVLCLEGNGSGSGEAGRHQQVLLLVDPLASKPVFLHLPSLFSSCRAVMATANGQIVFPKNSYRWNESQDTRTGLQVSYFTFEHGKFVPTGKVIELQFVSPENPFEFSPQDNGDTPLRR